MASSSQQEAIIEERNAEMVPYGGGKPILRDAHFLKPLFPQTLLSSKSLNSSQNTKLVSSLLKYQSKLQFNGWRSSPMKNWNTWVEKMSTLHGKTWRKASIYEAIMLSKLEIRRCYASLFALAEKWCPETNTFVLNWGEISVTLEDVMVLGGFSLIGECSSCESLCDKKMLEIEEKLIRQRAIMIRSSSKKASQQQWMDKWMNSGSEIEHEAFLSLWLSRYVLPANDIGTISKSVLRIAVVLAKGTRIALAPVVLASIYRDLRLLRENIRFLRNVGSVECDSVGGIKLWAPLQLFQAWIWERFMGLSPKPNRIVNGFRLERWNKVKLPKIDNVNDHIDSAGESFRWRPYSTPLSNWSFSPRLYPDKAKWMSIESTPDLDVESYVKCVRSCELVGFESDCVEKYLPHRVSMQFGLDQDIPYGETPWFGDNKMTAWTNFHRPIVNIRVYIPSKRFESDVTTRYLKWWRNYEIKKEFKEADVPPGFDLVGKKAALNDCDSRESERSKGSRHHVSSVTNSNDANTSSHSTKKVKRVVDDEDDSDDHMTLSQLRKSKHLKSADNNSIVRTLYSAEDNEPLEETGEMECFRSSLADNKGEAGGSSCCITDDPLPKMDLLDRIARLRRIVDVFKATKYGSD